MRRWKPSSMIWGFPKIMGTFLGAPILRTIVYWGPCWGTLILGNFHLVLGSRVWAQGFRFGVKGLGFRDQVLGFGI